MTYIITDGSNAVYNNFFNDGGHEFTFDCEPDDIDTAYDALAECLSIADEDGNPYQAEAFENNDSKASDLLRDFQNAKDDDVETLLNDMKRMGFIDSWEAEEEA